MMELIPQLPFPVAEWPPLRVSACPYDDRAKHGSSERGLMWAHYQIILDFAYFDWDVEEKYIGGGGMEPGSIYYGTTYSAVSSKMVAVGPNPPKRLSSQQQQNLRKRNLAEEKKEKKTPTEEDWYYYEMGPGLYKDGIPFRDDDLLVILEDDAEIAIKDISNTLIEEFNDMKDIDLLYLGWCEGRTARPIPLCTHAYAITRKGAKSLIKHFEPCGLAYDWQLVTYIRNKWLTYRSAHHYSFGNNYKQGYKNSNTRGIFQQSHGTSFNHGSTISTVTEQLRSRRRT